MGLCRQRITTKDLCYSMHFQLFLILSDSLRKDNDIVIMEGAGSPAEINIQQYDVANMVLARKVSAPVIIVCPISKEVDALPI